MNQRNGVRWNASKAFLRPAVKRPNLTVMTGALAKKLRLEGRRAAGVEFFQGREEVYAEAIELWRARTGRHSSAA